MKRVFVDTSALLAHLDADDPRHPLVRAAFASLGSDVLVTHGYVVAESIAVARRRLGVEGVIVLLDEILPAIELVPVEPSVHAEAQRRYREALPTGTSFVDHVSLAIIARERIDAVLALEPDLAVGGAVVIPTA